jgi:hypothetical protein
LFSFLLHARKKGIAEGNKKIAPAKLLPVVVAWFVMASVLYPITMIGIAKTVNELVYRKSTLADTLARVKKVATDTTKPSEERLIAARFYYKYSGERIIYIDENIRSKEYLPNENTNQWRLKYLEGLQQQRYLYQFLVVSGVLSLLSGLTVATIYFRSRKITEENLT